MVQDHDDRHRAGVHGGPDHIVLYPTWTGLLAVTGSPLLLLGLGSLALGGGASTLGWVLIGIGGLLGWVAGRDFPRHVVIGPEGIERRCLLRHHRLGFDEIEAIRRAPSRRRLRSSGGMGGGFDARLPNAQDEPTSAPSGLLAAGAGRRWMLTDQSESRAEFNHLAEVLVAVGGPVLEAPPPSPGSAPTSLYRRSVPPAG